VARLAATGRTVVEITRAQMAAFDGNALELVAADGASVLAMSARARNSFDARAIEALLASAQRVVAVPIPTIEERGGGSVRCMLAEVFLPRFSDMAQPGR
jgi:hypothetical protein